jgi:hypothetical protein
MSNEGAHFKVPNNLGLSRQTRCEFHPFVAHNHDGSKRCLNRLYNAKMLLIPNCSRHRDEEKGIV